MFGGYPNQPGWNGPYNNGNGMNGEYYQQQPMYGPGPGPPFGQGFGNQYQYQGPGPMPMGQPAVPFGNYQPNAYSGVHDPQAGLMGPPPFMIAPPFINPGPTSVQEPIEEGPPPPAPGTESSSIQMNSTEKVERVRRDYTSSKDKEKGAKKSDTNLEIMEGLVTACCKDYGFMGPDVFFSTSTVRGNVMPNVGDLVLIEAEKVEGLKFQYVAKKVQVLKLNAAPASFVTNAQIQPMYTTEESSSFLPENTVPLKKPLRNPPPPPIISKTKTTNSPSKVSRSPSESRSRSKDRRHSRHRSKTRSRSPHHRSGHRRTRSKSRGRTSDGHRRRSRSRKSSSRDRRTSSHDRSRRTRTRSKSPRKSHRTSSKDRKNLTQSPGLNLLDLDSFLDDLIPKVNYSVAGASQSTARKPLEQITLHGAFKPAFIDESADKVRKDNNKTKVGDSKDKKIDLVDYNIWGIPELPNLKTPQESSTSKQKDHDDSSKKKNSSTTSTTTASKTNPTKSKQISIKLGFMENKVAKGESSTSTSKITTRKSPVVRYNESANKSKPDLFKEHVLKISDKSTSSHVSDNKLKESKREKTQDTSRNKQSSDHRKRTESSNHRHQESKKREDNVDQDRKSKKEHDKRQDEFEHHLRISETSHRRSGSSAGDSSSRHSRSTNSKSDSKKRVKSPVVALRLTSPKVSLVLTDSRDRSPTPTEEEIRERERQIKMRELQLEEERILLEKRLNRMSSRSPSSDDEPLLLFSTLSPHTQEKSRRSPESRRHHRRSRSASRSQRRKHSRSRSKSRHREEPTENERLVFDLGMRHSGRLIDLDLDEPPTPERTSYREPLELDLHTNNDGVVRRVRESPIPQSSRSIDDPSLVLRLGRILRNGHAFICYVCGKKGHHGTVCWFRQPGVTYPEDKEEPVPVL